MKPDQFIIFQKAAAMAATAHQGQTIRTTSIPYISHPVRVAAAVTGLFGCRDAEVAAAALLHDTLEKTDLPAEIIEKEFGPRVLQLVLAMTKTEGVRKKVYWDLLAKETWEARLIKMADALDHLDCPQRDLPRRIKSGQSALDLAFSDEPAIRKAREILKATLAEAAKRVRHVP